MDTITPTGFAIQNGGYAPAMIPNGYFQDMAHLVQYMTQEANMRDDLKAHYNSEAVISIYPAEEVVKEGKPFPLVRRVPGAPAYVHYVVQYHRERGFTWYPLS